MFTNTKLVLAAAVILGTASAAAAGSDRAHRDYRPAGQSQLQAGANGGYAAANRMLGAGRSGETGAILIQDRGYSFDTGEPYCGGKC
jgi:hypothetical protein